MSEVYDRPSGSKICPEVSRRGSRFLHSGFFVGNPLNPLHPEPAKHLRRQPRQIGWISICSTTTLARSGKPTGFRRRPASLTSCSGCTGPKIARRRSSTAPGSRRRSGKSSQRPGNREATYACSAPPAISPSVMMGKTTPMKNRTAALLVAAHSPGVTLVGAPLAVAPSANADVCAEAVGHHFSAGGCTSIAGDVAAGAAISLRSRRNPPLHRRRRSLLHPARAPLLTTTGMPMRGLAAADYPKRSRPSIAASSPAPMPKVSATDTPVTVSSRNTARSV